MADFIGESNILDGIMREDYVVETFGRRFQCMDKGFAKDEPVDVVVRPEDIDIVPVQDGMLTGTVTSITFKGMQYDVIVDFKGFWWLIQTTDSPEVGQRIGIPYRAGRLPHHAQKQVFRTLRRLQLLLGGI